MNTRLLSALACPICKQPVQIEAQAGVLICRLDRLAYPIRNGVPVMLPEEATRLEAGSANIPLAPVDR